MALRFASLGSGSKGNATLVQSDATCVMVDCGFSTREVERRMQRLDVLPEHLTAILVTHEHSDHVQGVARLARKYDIPVWMTAGTFAACRQRHDLANVQLFSSHDDFEVQDLFIKPFPVPHDAREPAQFVFSDGAVRLGVLTDTGCITPHIVECLTAADALLLEGNHDLDMLMNGQYPEHLKARVAGRTGHLSNDQSAELLQQIDCSRLQHLVGAHLSEKNNLPERVIDAFAEALGCEPDWIELADQQDGLDWKTVSGS